MVRLVVLAVVVVHPVVVVVQETLHPHHLLKVMLVEMVQLTLLVAVVEPAVLQQTLVLTPVLMVVLVFRYLLPSVTQYLP
tara:strand:+ start:231 stop:470 length:240 start_codon:yes stop_codon:yes gene_type:complete